MPNYMKDGGEMKKKAGAAMGPRFAEAERKAVDSLSAKDRMDLMKKAGKMGAMAAPMAEAVKDDSEPTEKEKEMMRQQVRERKMDEGTARGAAQYEGYAKGGVVTKGNGCAIRGVKKCKIC